jgi:hypothetical protein
LANGDRHWPLDVEPSWSVTWPWGHGVQLGIWSSGAYEAIGQNSQKPVWRLPNLPIKHSWWEW